MVGEKYTWTAIYKDRSELKQYNDDGSENLFKDIDQDKLMAFRVDSTNGKHLIVDLTNGLFVVNGLLVENELSGQDHDYRLIYYRRVKREISTVTTPENTSVKHFVGYQLDDDGENRQCILGIGENTGSLIINKFK